MTTGAPAQHTDELLGKPVVPGPDDGTTNYITGITDGNLTTPVRLGDYLAGVGVVFRLPKRNRKKEAAAAAAVADRRRVRIPVRLLVRIVGPIALVVLGYRAWDTYMVSVPMPAEVVGTWTTDDGRYAGRNFWLNQQSVAFQNGPRSDQFAVFRVKRITSRAAADTVFLNVDYEQNGSGATLAIAFRSSPVPELRMVNQPRVRWTRSGAAPAAR